VRRTPVLVLDNLGYAQYHDQEGKPFLPARDHDIRLVTDIALITDATGTELELVLGVQTADEDAAVEASDFACGFGGTPVGAIVAISESLLIPAGRLREKHGLPGQTEAEAVAFRDKVMMKRRLAERGVRVPEFAPLAPAAARSLARAHGTVVVKPRLGMGSVGVEILRTPEEVERCLDSNRFWLEELEVEEFVSGEQFHIDSVVDRGRVLAATVGRSMDPTTAYTDLLPYRDVALGPGTLCTELLEFNEAVLACFPEYTGVTHHEVFRTESEMVFCEIGARAGGGGVVAGFADRCGIDLNEVVVRTQLGRHIPAGVAVADHLTGYVLIYSDAGRLAAPVTVPDRPWVVNATVRAEAGTPVRRARHWGDYVAMVVVRGDTEAEVESRLAEVVDAVDISLVVESGPDGEEA